MKKIIISAVLAVFCLLTMMGCGSKNIYVFPDEVLELTGDSPEQRAENINREENIFPVADYGEVYVNDDGQLCYKLDEKQKNNWYEKGMNGLASVKLGFESGNKVFEYSDDLKELTVTADEEDSETTINYYVGEVLFVQFFGNDGDNLSLTTTVVDQDGNVLGVVKWPQTSGYFGDADTEKKK